MSVPLYKDPSQPVEERIKDLMSRMTTEEKVGQLVQFPGNYFSIPEYMEEQHPGSILHVLGDQCKLPIELAQKSRLGIPILIGIDAIHGHSFWRNATIFPTQLGIAQSWNEERIKEMASITASEMRYTGPCWTFSPVLCIARDLRWGRVGETFGEDPYLIGRFASAMVHGYQGDSLCSDPEKVMCTAKHYVGYSETLGGRDASEADHTPRKLQSYFLPQFKAACEAGAGTFMTGYSSIDGVPTTMSNYLLNEVLRDDWGFKGFLVTDWNNVGSLVENQCVCANYAEAAKVALENGNDLMMTTPKFYEGCLTALKEGILDMKYVDQACSRILRAKFLLGLFEDPRLPDESKALSRCNTPEHRQAALQAARESLILLENPDNFLPIDDKKYNTIAVVGSNSQDRISELGDWSLGTGQTQVDKSFDPSLVITSYDGIKARFPGRVIDNLDEPSDLVIAVVGDHLELWGETKSTATLEIPKEDKRLLKRLRKEKRPFIIVNLSYKPLIFKDKGALAVIQQFSPGMLGGQALAEAIFGDINPSGRLTISIPYHVGQQPIYYNQVRGQHGDTYADMTQKPHYPFGYGMSYTAFEYSDIKLNKDVFSMGEEIEVTLELKNTGNRKGVEVVQLYIHDVVVSATWAVMELKQYERVELEAGEQKKVSLKISTNDCSIVNAKVERVVEPGDFEIYVGSDSSTEGRKATLKFSIQ